MNLFFRSWILIVIFLFSSLILEASPTQLHESVNAFKVLWEAILASRDGLWASLQILIYITIGLAIIFYFAELKRSPRQNFNKAILWAFTRYIGDPGKLSRIQPQTITGRIIATTIGILGILIVAVPAGILGSGFNEALEKHKAEQKLAVNQNKLYRYFERKLDRPSGFQAVAFFRSFADIQSRTGMNESDIIETVEKSPDFRIINTAQTIPVEEKPFDRLAVELFPMNTSYGVCIDRGSRVTIVSTSNYIDPSIGVFSFYLAMIGNFNYISREIGDRIKYKSLFSVKEDEEYTVEEQDYFKDLKRLMARENSWSFDFMPVSGNNENAYDTEIHLGIGNAKGIEDFYGEDLLIKDIPRYIKFYDSLYKTMEENFNILCDNGKYHSTSSKTLWPRVFNLSKSSNSVVVRMAWSAILWNDNRLLIAQKFADCINENILNLSKVEVPEVLNQKGFGYEGYDL